MTFLLITALPLFAEVYKCDIEGSAYYTSTPCEYQVLNLEIAGKPFEDEFLEQERFITPSYPGWSNGWKKTRNMKLERFFEVIYEPIQVNESNKDTIISQQTLTNLPHSMSVQRFAVSVEDIIESICENTIIYSDNPSEQLSDNVFYGYYACPLRRDTKQGELGFYKIMRGENSIYMIAIKWNVDSFSKSNKQPLEIIDKKENKRKISIAKKYLRDDVKLCKAGYCI